ncbi:pre-60S factor REI1 [Viridothelium virens]|uniref:Pre-60S factor REI1 n=1 Tax=Viridothelium virens TaxID=1048519 RepID=A0A6A6H6W7_VIRVR|nr:pre-60S factor REI1 [Viridothelium virens]
MSASHTTNGTTHPFTCNSCQVAFRSSELQRTHMQSDWHRYNLKRRVASLPPLTSEVFAEKVLANKASVAATAARASFEKTCNACRKTYYSENAYQNHLSSQKHRALLAKISHRPPEREEDATSVMSSNFSLGEPLQTPTGAMGDKTADEEFAETVNGIKETSLEEGELKSPISRRPHRPTPSEAQTQMEHSISDAGTGTPVPSVQDSAVTSVEPSVQCLFCSFILPDLSENLAHMRKQHGLFIPEHEYLVDAGGLVTYLHEKVIDLHECLYCHQVKHTAVGAQAHMRDVGHCMIAYDSEEDMLEIGQFYDFRSTYSDDEEEEGPEDGVQLRSGGVKLGAKRGEIISVSAVGGNGDEEMVNEDEDGWESDSTLSSVPTDEIGAVPIQDFSHRYQQLGRHRHHSHSDPRPHQNSDGFHSHAHHVPHAVYHDEFEMHLPSGRTAGHRSLNRYYRQNLRNYPTPAERQEQRMITNESDSDTEMEGQTPPRGREHNRAIISRANGGMGMVGVSEPRKREAQAIEKRERRKEQRAQARYQWGNERRSNFQKHFRDPLLQ